ncbi:MAG: hypothetical protein RL685_2155, partial [Pseudomonadota bacterium]
LDEPFEALLPVVSSFHVRVWNTRGREWKEKCD